MWRVFLLFIVMFFSGTISSFSQNMDRLSDGQEFQDCEGCPVMVVVPSGSFLMGTDNVSRRYKYERPGRRVEINYRLAVGKFEVTKAQYAVFFDETGREFSGSCFGITGTKAVRDRLKSWLEPGFEQSPEEPAVCISWSDAKAYTEWLSAKTGERYRLLSEAEWEYAARAGDSSFRSWKKTKESCHFANLLDRSVEAEHSEWASDRCDDGWVYTAPVGSFNSNAFGLHDMLGNVWEFVEDCWKRSYRNAPKDGSARLDGECDKRVSRGGGWANKNKNLRYTIRTNGNKTVKLIAIGFRVAKEISN